MQSPSDTRSVDVRAYTGLRAARLPRAWLLVEHAGNVWSVPLRLGVPLVVGRARPADLVLDDPSVSRRHAQLTWSGEVVEALDLGSKNGMRLRGELTAQTTLVDGDELSIAGAVLRVQLGSEVRRDEQPLFGYGELVQRLRDEIARAQLFRRGLALLAFEAEGGVKLPKVFSALRCVDVLGRYSEQVILLLMPEASREDAVGMIKGTLAELPAARAGWGLVPDHGSSADELIDQVLAALRRAAPSQACEAETGKPKPDEPPRSIVIADERMRRLYETIARVARVSMHVLVLGETGVGKELVARALHDQSPRAKGPFRAINCAAISPSLLESELFGHERGAFTGADRQRPGVFEQADGGTVFLDEVGELDQRAQAALLRVLETRSITRVGSTREIPVDVRVVTATHRDLERMVEQGSFRRDLWFRLDAMTFEVPPLRERLAEIEPLAACFLEDLRARTNTPARRLSEEALSALSAYDWPGNVRQLRNVIERACAICAGPEIGIEDLPDTLHVHSPKETPARAAPVQGALPDRVRAFETEQIRHALAAAGGNQSQAARVLGIPRRTLAYRMQVLGIGAQPVAPQGT